VVSVPLRDGFRRDDRFLLRENDRDFDIEQEEEKHERATKKTSPRKEEE
jgi:hypothetical protein